MDVRWIYVLRGTKRQRRQHGGSLSGEDAGCVLVRGPPAAAHPLLGECTGRQRGAPENQQTHGSCRQPAAGQGWSGAGLCGQLPAEERRARPELLVPGEGPRSRGAAGAGSRCHLRAGAPGARGAAARLPFGLGTGATSCPISRQPRRRHSECPRVKRR